MAPDASSYYPPRAQDRWLPRWLTGGLDRTGVLLRRLFARSPLAATVALSLTGAEFLRCLAIPGHAYRRLGQPLLATVFQVGWVACLGVALVFLGSPMILGWSIGGMASCHASGIGFLILRERETSRGFPESLRGRIGIPFAAWLACATLLYWPGFGLFQRTVAKPLHLQLEDRSIIINPRTRPTEVRRNDLIAYEVEDFRIRGRGELPVNFRGGLLLGRAIALPGERVEFGPRAITVNGQTGPRIDSMPVEGGLTVAPGEWLVWPTVDLRVVNNQRLDTTSLNEALHRLSAVSHGNFVGRAYSRWFLLRQDTP